MSTATTSALDAAAPSPSAVPFDPRIRLATCLGLLCLLPLLTAPSALVLLLALGALATWRLSGLPLALVGRRLLVAEGFLLALFVTLPFTVPGRPVFEFLGLVATEAGLWRALTLMLRITAAILLTLGLLGPLGAIGTARALRGLGLPVRLAALVELSLRHVGILEAEYRRLTRAMQVRGFRLRNTRHSWRSIGNLLGMLLVRAFDRADRVRWAMLCRGYAGHFPAPPDRRLVLADYLLFTAAIVAALLLLALELQS